MTEFNESRFAESLIAFRHELHRFPELSHQEFETTARLRARLGSHHIRILDLPLKTGLVAEIGDPQGPLVVLRSDIDALPIEEQSGVEYRSQIRVSCMPAGMTSIAPRRWVQPFC